MRWHALIAALVLSACTSTIGTAFNVDSARRLAIGSTTPDAAVALLGPPNSRDIAADGTETWQYLYVRSTSSPTAAGFIPYAGPFLPNNSRINTSSQQLRLVFSGGILSDCTLITTERAGTGGGVAGSYEALAESMMSGTTTTVACGRSGS